MQTLVIRTKQYTNNSLNIWAETPQQLKPITADPIIKKCKSSNLNHMQQLISWSKNLAVLHFKQILLKLLGESGS